MDQRIRIGIVHLWSQIWHGGAYYISNLVYALNTLPDINKPIIDIYCKTDRDFYDLQKETGYPYLVKNLIRPCFIRKAFNRIVYYFSKKLYFRTNPFRINRQDTIIYPYNCGFNSDKLIYWHPDFQDKYYPEFFSKKTIKNRDREICVVCKRNIPIVFSSYDSQRDFNSFFPQFKNNSTFVVHFAVHQQDYSEINIELLKRKFGINKPYIICANQFWKHKNHAFLFSAFKEAVDNGLDMQLVCTGKMIDYRDSGYIDELLLFVRENKLEKTILTLGVIEKTELLCLMKNSYAVIQPSLFEGWNTTVEDCKAMSKFLFLSDIMVHREQIEKNVCFFNPTDKEDLVNKLLTVLPKEVKIDYDLNIRRFADDFYKVIQSKNVMI